VDELGNLRSEARRYEASAQDEKHVKTKNLPYSAANLVSPITEYKEHRVDNVAFPASVWPNDATETLVKWADLLDATIALEILL